MVELPPGLRSPTFRIFLTRFIPAAAVVLVAVVLFLGLRTRTFRAEVRADQQALARVEAQKLHGTFTSAVADAVYLSELTLQNRYLQPTTSRFHGVLASEFLAFLRSRTVFDRVAFLGLDGREEVRVDRAENGIRRVPSGELDDHGSHAHLIRVMGNPGLTWFSPTDPLAVQESEGEEEALQLFLNRALPIEGEGSILLRISLRAFLEEIREEYLDRRSELLLATMSGDWLLTRTGVQEAGAESIGDVAPELWAAVEEGGEGSVFCDQGLFAFAPVRFSAPGGTDAIPGSRVGAQEDWVVLTHTPPDALQPGDRGMVIALGLLALLSLAFLIWSWAEARAAREEALEKVREREAFLHAATAAIQDGVIVVNGRGEVTLWNPGATEIFGYPAAEMMGRALHEVITPPETREEAAAGIRAFAATGTGPAIGETHQLSGLRRDGSRFPAELSLSAFRKDGEHYCVGVVRDITERKAVEERLALSEQILNSIGDVVLVADARGDVIFASPSVGTVLGYEPQEVLGDGWWRMTRPDDPREAAAEREETARRARGEQASDEGEYDREIRHRDGGTRWIRWRESPGPGATLVGIGADVTQRKEGEAARQRLAALIRHTSDFVGYADMDGTCEFVNRGGLEMVGLESVEEACDRALFDFLHPEDLEIFRDRILTSVMEGDGWEGEIRFVDHGGGEPIPVHGSIFPVLDERTGDPVAIGGTFKDIQARKELEENLLDAVRKAEAANVAKQRFLANMSHEIRTPMNAIVGMADLLWETELTQDQRDYVQVFRNAGDTLLALINDVLDLAKVEEGRLELEEVGFDLRDVLEGTVETFAVVAHGKGLEIGARVAPDVPSWVLGDPGRLRQILSNLVGNAVKFTEEGEVLVEVVLREGETNGRHVPPHEQGEVAPLLFSVRDTGVGIPKDKLQTVFGRFTQADSSTTRRFGGSGLGLTICERLVGLMGGRIWVESTEGEGSAFRFAVDLPVTQPPPSQDVELADLRSLPVLVVDDNATNRLILREMLASWGARVEEAPGARVARDLLRGKAEAGEPIALCLLDGEMPETDGYELAAELRDDPSLGGPLVMILTSHGDGRSRSAMKKLGLSGHLMKPVRRPTLLHAITEALGGRGPLAEGSGVFPASKETSSGGRDDEAPAPKDGPSESPFRILVAEDSPDNRMLMKAYLKKTDYELHFVENGEEALEACTNGGGRFDLVFMDIQMPVMDGYDATRAIRAREEEEGLEPLRIVALSAHAMKEEVQKSLDAGCDDHLTKPVKKDRLLGYIRDIAEGAS